MIRRYNYTGRKKISRTDAQVIIDDDPLRFHAALKLAEYGMPANARVFVEAYRQTNWMRFDFGSFGAIQAPEDCRLTEFDTREGILFRVKITASADPEGRLLAEADQISPGHRSETGEESRDPLLPIKPEDLGDEVFRVDYADGPPILKVNNRFGDWRALVRHPSFVCFALPQAFREILSRILWVEGYFETEDDSAWQARWLRFASVIPGCSEPPESEEEKERFDDWINDAVAAFARMNGIKDKFNIFWAGGAEL